MRILHLSTKDIGGAAKACLRLHKSLLELGVESRGLVRDRSLEVPETYAFGLPRRPFSARAVRKAKRIFSEFGLCHHTPSEPHAKDLEGRPPGFDMFSFPDSNYDVIGHPFYREADLIHLHWVAGFVDFASFFAKIDKPVVWTLHDMNAFTGGCHYAGDCRGYRHRCADCPQLAPTKNSLAGHNLALKRRSLAASRRRPSLVAPSRWLQIEAGKSALFGDLECRLIPYGIDDSPYQPMDRAMARRVLGIPDEGPPLLLFVAEQVGNPRKGFNLLLEALAQQSHSRGFRVAVAGDRSADCDLDPKVYTFLGRIRDERLMRVAYCAADVFVAPSIEDNLPNTVLESLACGTPVVAFRTGGMPDMVTDGKNGILADSKNSAGLGDAIRRGVALSRERPAKHIHESATSAFNQRRQAEAYLDLYGNLLRLC